MKYIYFKNQKIDLQKLPLLGSGGEANVFEISGEALKIFHKNNIKKNSKLSFLSNVKNNLPKNISFPTNLAYDLNNQICGYSMNIIEQSFVTLNNLRNKKYRNLHSSITNKTVVELLLHMYKTTADLHANNIQIGDYNDLNILFNGNRSYFIDTDSFQMNNLPCEVGTEEYLDPNLYDIDLSTNCYFKKENDWYSWFTMFIYTSLFVHPYGGVDKNYKYKNIQQRAKANLTVFDSNIIYPKVGRNPEFLTSSLMDLFDRIYKQNQRFVPDIKIFEDYNKSLKKCSSCDSYFSSEKTKCPECSKVNTQINIVQKPTVIQGNVKSELIHKLNGNLLWFTVDNKVIYFVTEEKGIHYFYKTENNATEKVEIDDKYVKYNIFQQKYIIGYKNQIAYFLDIKTGKKISYKPVDSFNNEPVFDCSLNHFYYIYNSSLRKGNFQYSSFSDIQINTFAKNNCWFFASKNSEQVFGFDRILGMNRLFNINFTNSKNGQTFYIDLKLEDNESIFDKQCYFSGTLVLLYLKTEIKGKSYTRVMLIKDGQVLKDYKVSSLSNDIYKNINGKMFMFNGNDLIVLHSTDEGIIKETVNSQTKISKINQTDNFVSDESIVYPYKQGIIVANLNDIQYLTIS